MSADRTEKATKAQKLSRVAKDSLFALADLAGKGDKGAAAELYSTVTVATDWLSWLSQKKPEIFSPIAARRFVWPVLYGPHKEHKEEADRLINQLRVGVKTGINISSVGKAFSWERPANVIAFSILRLAEALRHAPIPSDGVPEIAACGVGQTAPGKHRYDDKYVGQLMALETWGQTGAGSRLPPLSRSTAKQWAKELPAFFRLIFGEEFDKHPKLRELKKAVPDHDKQGKPLRIGDVRKLMLQRVKQALSSSLAPLD